MGLGRRNFLTRTATVVGTIGAAGSAESWAKEAKANKGPEAKKIYDGYYDDLQKLTAQVEKRHKAWEDFDGFPEEPKTERDHCWSRDPKPQPEWDEYDEKNAKAFQRRVELTGVILEQPHWMAPLGIWHFSQVFGQLEQEEAKPILVVSSPVNFGDVRIMEDSVKDVSLVYDEGPIRARIFTVPVVTTTALDFQCSYAVGIKTDGKLSLIHVEVTR